MTKNTWWKCSFLPNIRLFGYLIWLSSYIIEFHFHLLVNWMEKDQPLINYHTLVRSWLNGYLEWNTEKDNNSRMYKQRKNKTLPVPVNCSSIFSFSHFCFAEPTESVETNSLSWLRLDEAAWHDIHIFFYVFWGLDF